MHHPGFSCPLCRTFANLEEDVEVEVEEGVEETDNADDSAGSGVGRTDCNGRIIEKCGSIVALHCREAAVCGLRN